MQSYTGPIFPGCSCVLCSVSDGVCWEGGGVCARLHENRTAIMRWLHGGEVVLDSGERVLKFLSVGLYRLQRGWSKATMAGREFG